MSNSNDEVETKCVKDISLVGAKIFEAGAEMLNSLSSFDPNLDISKLSSNERKIICLHLSNWVGLIGFEITTSELSKEEKDNILSLINALNKSILKLENEVRKK